MEGQPSLTTSDIHDSTFDLKNESVGMVNLAVER